jgi:hypothetical protein
MKMQRSTRLEFETLEDRVTPATLTWTGAVDGLWSDPGNWSTSDVTHTVPMSGDAVVLPAGAPNRVQTDFSVNLSSLAFQDVGYSISGDQIDILMSGQISATSSTFGTDQIACDINSTGFVVISFGSSLELSLTGNVTISSSGPFHEVGLTVSGPSSALLSIGGNLSFAPTGFAGAGFVVDTQVAISGSVSIPFGDLVVHASSRVDVEPGGVLSLEQDAGAFVSGQLYVAGVAALSAPSNVDGGLILIESGGQLFVAGPLTVASGEVYDAGLMVVERSDMGPDGQVDVNGSGSFLVIAAGGELYSAELTETTAGGQIYDFGVVEVASGGTGLYVYDGVLTVEQGGALYVYGTVAIEPDSALYDYGNLVLEPSGYLYNADLVVIEQGGVFYDYGTFANFGNYYNFGQQIGSGG